MGTSDTNSKMPHQKRGQCCQKCTKLDANRHLHRTRSMDWFVHIVTFCKLIIKSTSRQDRLVFSVLLSFIDNGRQHRRQNGTPAPAAPTVPLVLNWQWAHLSKVVRICKLRILLGEKIYNLHCHWSCNEQFLGSWGHTLLYQVLNGWVHSPCHLQLYWARATHCCRCSSSFWWLCLRFVSEYGVDLTDLPLPCGM